MKNIIKCMGLIFWISLMSSCSDFLNVSPYGVVSEEILTNKEGVDKLLIGAYSTLDGLASNDWYVWNNYWSTDDARFGSNMGLTNLDAYLHTATDGDLALRWKTLYGMINRSNAIMECK